MAIVMTIKSSLGGMIYVADDCYRDVPEEELQRRRDETGRVILAIDRRAQLDRMRQEQAEDRQPRA